MKRVRVEFRWAVFFVIMQVLWMAMEKGLGLHGEHIAWHPILTNLIAIPALAFFYFALLDKRRNVYDGEMNYKQGFLTGLVLSLFITVLTPFTIYFSLEVISPEYFENAIAYSVEKGHQTKEEAKAYFNFETYVKQGTVGALFMGIVTSALVAAFAKKKEA